MSMAAPIAMPTPVVATAPTSAAAPVAATDPAQDFLSALASVLQTPATQAGDTTLATAAAGPALANVAVAAPPAAKPSGTKAAHGGAQTPPTDAAASATVQPLLPTPTLPTAALPPVSLPAEVMPPITPPAADTGSPAQEGPVGPANGAGHAAPRTSGAAELPAPGAPPHFPVPTPTETVAAQPPATAEAAAHHLAAPLSAAAAASADATSTAQASAPPPSHPSAPSVPVLFTAPAASPTPTTQVGAAFVVVARQPGEAQSLTLHLQPPDLGRVAIAIDQPKDSGAKISLTAEQPETLLMLMRDQPSLHKALDSAGIAAEGRTLSFHLAAAEGIAPAAATSQPQDSGSSLSNGSNPHGQDGGGQTGMNDFGGRNPNGSPSRQPAGYSGAPDPAAGFTFTASQPVARLLPRSAVDITA